MHLVHPQKFVFNFSWDDCNTQDNSEETMVTDFFFGGGGERWGNGYYGLCENGE